MKKSLSYILFWMLGCLSASAASYTFDINKGISFSWQYDDVIGVNRVHSPGCDGRGKCGKLGGIDGDVFLDRSLFV